jgi:hypothetical protein
MDAQRMMDLISQSGWMLPALAAWLIGGAAIGLAYFLFLRHVTGLMVTGKAGPARALLLVLLRVAGLGGVLLISAMQGVAYLLAAALGVMIGRQVVMYRTRKAN